MASPRTGARLCGAVPSMPVGGGLWARGAAMATRPGRRSVKGRRAGGADASPAAADPEVALLARLRAGDASAFSEIVDRYHRLMHHVVRTYVSNRTVGEEVVQETWLAVLRGLDRFEGRSTLKTWIFRILANRARTRAVREGRSVPFSALWAAEAEHEPAVDPSRFGPNRNGEIHWVTPPRTWPRPPGEEMVEEETFAIVREVIGGLPASQRTVITMRDLDGWTSQEVCDALEITSANQRVLLHRARTKVRAALERVYG